MQQDAHTWFLLIACEIGKVYNYNYISVSLGILSSTVVTSDVSFYAKSPQQASFQNACHVHPLKFVNLQQQCYALYLLQTPPKLIIF